MAPAPQPMHLDPRDQAIAGCAGELASCALSVLGQRFPHKLDHLILHAGDHPLPQDIHPVFDGCYDWHSSVHMHWSVLRLRALAPGLAGLPQAQAITARFDTHFKAELVARELAYLQTPGRGSFERPYGWAWLLKLQAELQAPCADAKAAGWARALQPLTDSVVDKLLAFLHASHYPVRAGTHANSAFALLLALDHANTTGHRPLQACIAATARRWFGDDQDYPARYEPSGSDFLSPGLCEALLMQRVLGEEFHAWWHAFLPGEQSLAPWDRPAIVSSRLDAQLVHLDGLNLSRAWCLQALASSAAAVLQPRQRERLLVAAQRHWQAAWPHVTGGDFVATHWLLSFALLR